MFYCAAGSKVINFSLSFGANITSASPRPSLRSGRATRRELQQEAILIVEKDA
jgi:hypothetical protein